MFYLGGVSVTAIGNILKKKEVEFWLPESAFRMVVFKRRREQTDIYDAAFHGSPLLRISLYYYCHTTYLFVLYTSYLIVTANGLLPACPCRDEKQNQTLLWWQATLARLHCLFLCLLSLFGQDLSSFVTFSSGWEVGEISPFTRAFVQQYLSKPEKAEARLGKEKKEEKHSTYIYIAPPLYKSLYMRQRRDTFDAWLMISRFIHFIYITIATRYIPIFADDRDNRVVANLSLSTALPHLHRTKCPLESPPPPPGAIWVEKYVVVVGLSSPVSCRTKGLKMHGYIG